jgi:hypothetical protein
VSAVVDRFFPHGTVDDVEDITRNTIWHLLQTELHTLATNLARLIDPHQPRPSNRQQHLAMRARA